ncbi:MAG: two-component regulator propeller domain-containing protein [Flavisolibacter sp.]
MRIFLLLLVLLFSIPASSQQARQYSFKHFSVMNGLASNRVNAVIQDKDGYIWMATQNGLQRYDGYSFITFTSRKDDSTSIPSNFIVYMFLDAAKNLWIQSDNERVGIFDTKKFLFREATLPVEKKKYLVQQGFTQTPEGMLLMAKSDGGLLRYNEKTSSFVDASGFIPFPPKWIRSSVTWDPFIQKYWMSSDSGIVQYDPKTRELNYRGHNPGNDPVIQGFGNINRTISRIFIDGRGDVLFIFWQPAAGGPTQKAEQLYTGIRGYHEIYSYLQQRNGRLWIYGYPFFAEWKDGSKPFNFIPNEYHGEQSILFDYAVDAFEDKESNIWIATDNGVFLFNPDSQIFNIYNLVRNDGGKVVDAPVTAMEETRDGKFFLGCWNSSGIFYFDKEFNPIPLPACMKNSRELSVWDVATQPKTGDIWFTLQGGGIAIYSKNKNQFRVVKPPIFESSTIRQVDEDTSGNLWFGTQSGKLIKWDCKLSKNDPLKGYEVVYQTSRIQKVHFDYKGFVWLATLGQGLIKIDVHTKKMIKTFSTTGPEGERLFNDAPSDMTYFNDSTLIVSAGCINIVNTKTNKISFITTDEGLPSNTAISVQRGSNGILWVGMINGICRINLEKKLITYYDRREGIAQDKFTLGGVKQIRDGRLVFFTDHNFLVFDPRRFSQGRKPASPSITAFRLSGRSVSLDSILENKRAVLRYNNTSIGINFSALTYQQQQKTHYYYMLEGLDKEWIRTDNPIEAIYNFLPPGNYVFKVKSESADGLPGEHMAMLPIMVRAPVWQTWWFYSLIALLVIAVLYLLDRERIIKQNSLREIRRQIRGNLRNEVSTTLNNISVLSEIAKIKADKNIEQAKDFIDQISDKSRHMAEALDDTLWTIDPANDNMKKIVLRIKEFTEGLRSDYQTSVDLIVDHKVQSLDLDMKLRHEFFFFYKEALLFIVQNMNCEQIFVNLNMVRSKLLVEILCECPRMEGELKEKFRRAIDKRVKAMAATIEIIADSRSFASVLHVAVKG